MLFTFIGVQTVSPFIWLAAGSVAPSVIAEYLEELQKVVHSMCNPRRVVRPGREFPVTEGMNQASGRGHLILFLKARCAQALIPAIDFHLKTAASVALGAAHYAQDRLFAGENWPAFEYRRLHQREIPRGFKRDANGLLVADPHQGWPARWRAAADESKDTEALRVLEETGRMIALKRSPIWQALGNGAGGYCDALGNPFEPFAIDSGFRQMNIDLLECQKLGIAPKKFNRFPERFTPDAPYI